MDVMTSDKTNMTSSVSEPIVRTWFMVDTYFWPFFVSFVYVLFVTTIGPFYMRTRKPFDLRYTMIVYNFSLVIIYIDAVIKILFNTVYHSLYHQICHAAIIEENTPTYEVATYAHLLYMLKYVEYLDTIFFVLRKKFKNVSNLHLIHHTIMPIACWWVFRTEISGYQLIPGVINAFVHIIMYSYYGLAAVGPSVQKYLWWKKYLTMLQMGQFVVIILYALLFAPLTGCSTPDSSIYLDYFLAGLFLVLFYNFFIHAYNRPKRNYSSSQHGNFKDESSIKNGNLKKESSIKNGKVKT